MYLSATQALVPLVCLLLNTIQVEGHKNEVKSYLDTILAFNKVLDRSTPKPHDSPALPTLLYDLYESGYFSVLDSLLLENSNGQSLEKEARRRLYESRLSELFEKVSNTSGSSTCLNDTARLVRGIVSRNKWAWTFADASGKIHPGLSELHLNWPGDYRYCMSLAAPTTAADNRTDNSFNGGYCVAKVILGAQTPSDINPIANILQVNWGICMPHSCSSQDLTSLFNQLSAYLDLEARLNTSLYTQVTCLNDEREYSTATIIAIVFLVIIGLMMVVGTAYDVIYCQIPKWNLKKYKDSEYGGPSSLQQDLPVDYQPIMTEDAEDREKEALLRKATQVDVRATSVHESVCSKVLVSFSIYTNGAKILNTSHPPGSLTAINGIRFLSMTWVILGHTFVFGIPQIENVVDAIPRFLDRWTFDAVSNAFVSVDTFFTLSGLLTAYTIVNEMKKRGTARINWPLVYFHRYWRLTPPYMLALLTVLGLQRFMGAGPLWSPVQPMDEENCKKYWWTNILYLNNLVDVQHGCFGHSWYLANDMQFFWLSPLMIVPFFIHAYLGVAMCGVFLLTTWITTGALSSHHGWFASLVSENPKVTAATADFFKNYYIVPWCRIGPCVVGILTGCILAANGGRIRMSRAVWVLGWVVSWAVALAVVYGIHDEITGKVEFSVGTNALYNAVVRSAWGACVCWVIVACVSGYGGFVDTLLSWGPFAPLGRMSYMAYLIHPCVIYVYFGNMDVLYHLNDTNLVVTFLGIVVVTYMFAFVFMLGFESPMIGLEKVLLRKETKQS